MCHGAEARGLGTAAVADLLAHDGGDVRDVRGQAQAEMFDAGVEGDERVRPAALDVGVDAPHAVGIGDVLWRAEQQPVEHVGHHHRRADAEREDADGGGGAPAISREAAGGEADVLQERVERWQPALANPLEPGGLDAAEVAPGRRARLGLGQPAAAIVVGQQRQVGLDFLAHPVVPATGQRCPHPSEQHPQAGHDRESSSRLTIATVRAQVASSSASCFTPRLVML